MSGLNEKTLRQILMKNYQVYIVEDFHSDVKKMKVINPFVCEI